MSEVYYVFTSSEKLWSYKRNIFEHGCLHNGNLNVFLWITTNKDATSFGLEWQKLTWFIDIMNRLVLSWVVFSYLLAYSVGLLPFCGCSPLRVWFAPFPEFLTFSLSLFLFDKMSAFYSLNNPKMTYIIQLTR